MLIPFALLVICVTVQGIDVQTEYGTVRGHTVTVTLEDQSQKVINSFLSIPFAAPPIGNLRFEVC